MIKLETDDEGEPEECDDGEAAAPVALDLDDLHEVLRCDEDVSRESSKRAKASAKTLRAIQRGRARWSTESQEPAGEACLDTTGDRPTVKIDHYKKASRITGKESEEKARHSISMRAHARPPAPSQCSPPRAFAVLCSSVLHADRVCACVCLGIRVFRPQPAPPHPARGCTSKLRVDPSLCARERARTVIGTCPCETGEALT